MARNRVLDTIQDDFGNAIGGADVIVTAYRKGTDTVRTRYIAATGTETAANPGRANPGLDTELSVQALPADDEITVPTTLGWAAGDVVHIRSGDNVARRVVKTIPSGTVLALDATIGGAFTYPVGSTVRSPVGSWQGFFDDAHDTEIEVENDATGEFSGRKQWRTGTVGGIQPTLLDAKGDLIVASADNTPARRAVGADGTVLTADSAEVDGVKWATSPIVRKTADQTVNNSETLVDDTHLKQAIGANEIWEFELWLIGSCTSATPHWKGTMVGPTGSTVNWSFTPGTRTNGDSGAENARVRAGGVEDDWQLPGEDLALGIRGIIVNGSTAGDLKLRWAQYVAAVVDTKIKTNSFLVARKVG